MNSRPCLACPKPGRRTSAVYAKMKEIGLTN